MKIYFVSARSTAAGPSDLILPNGQEIEVGDVCVVAGEGRLTVRLIRNPERNWSGQPIVGICPLSPEVDGWGNCLLYSFDGIGRRTGNVARLEAVCGALGEGVGLLHPHGRPTCPDGHYTERGLQSEDTGQARGQTKAVPSLKADAFGRLLVEAVAILRYRKDLMDAGVLAEVYAEAGTSHNHQSNSAQVPRVPYDARSADGAIPISHPDGTLHLSRPARTEPTGEPTGSFLSYLPEGMQKKEVLARLEHETPQEVMRSVRKAHPDEFREAFRRFNADRPGASIYEGL